MFRGNPRHTQQGFEQFHRVFKCFFKIVALLYTHLHANGIPGCSRPKQLSPVINPRPPAAPLKFAVWYAIPLHPYKSGPMCQTGCRETRIGVRPWHLPLLKNYPYCAQQCILDYLSCKYYDLIDKMC